MKRYDEIVGGEHDSNMEFRENGEWVKYSDAEKLEKTIVSLKAETQEIIDDLEDMRRYEVEKLEKRVKELELDKEELQIALNGTKAISDEWKALYKDFMNIIKPNTHP